MTKEEFEKSLNPEQLEFFKDFNRIAVDAFGIAEQHAHSAHNDYMTLCKQYTDLYQKIEELKKEYAKWKIIMPLPFHYAIFKKED